MPRVRIGNKDDLRALNDTDLRTLMTDSMHEKMRRRQILIPGPGKRRTAERRRDRRLVYVSWHDVNNIMAQHYPNDRKAAFHASRVWGAAYNMTQYGLLKLEGYCDVCGIVPRKTAGGQYVAHGVGCPSRGLDSAKTILFSRRSLVDNRVNVRALWKAQFPDWVKDDYDLIVDALKKQM